MHTVGCRQCLAQSWRGEKVAAVFDEVLCVQTGSTDRASVSRCQGKHTAFVCWETGVVPQQHHANIVLED